MKPQVDQKRRRGRKKIEKIFIKSNAENPIENELIIMQRKSPSSKNDFISADAIPITDTISEIGNQIITSQNKAFLSMVQQENIETTVTDTRPLINPLETPVQENKCLTNSIIENLPEIDTYSYQENKADDNETNNDTLGQPEFIQLFQAFDPISPPKKKISSQPHDVINANTCSQEIDINKLTLTPTNANEAAVDNSVCHKRDEEHLYNSICSQELVSKLAQSQIIEHMEKSFGDLPTSQTRNILPSTPTNLFSSQQQNNQSPIVDRIEKTLNFPNSQTMTSVLPIIPTVCSQEQEHAISYKSQFTMRIESPCHTPSSQTPHIQANINIQQNKDEKPSSPLVEQNNYLSKSSSGPLTPITLFSSQKQDSSILPQSPDSPIMHIQEYSQIPNSQIPENTTSPPTVKDNIFFSQTKYNFIPSQTTDHIEKPSHTPSKHSITPKHTPSKILGSQSQHNSFITQSPIIESSITHNITPIRPPTPILPSTPQQINTNRLEESIIIEDRQSPLGSALPEKISQTTYVSQPTIETIVLSDDSLDSSECNISRIYKQATRPCVNRPQNYRIIKLNTPHFIIRNRNAHTPLPIERIPHNISCPIPGVNSFFHSSPVIASNSQPSCRFVRKQPNSTDYNYSQFFSKGYTQPHINRSKDYQLFCATTTENRCKFPQPANPFNTNTPQVFRNVVQPTPLNVLKYQTETSQIGRPNKNIERNQTVLQQPLQTDEQQQQQQQLKCHLKSDNTSLAQKGLEDTCLNSPQRDNTETVGGSPILLALPTELSINVEQNMSLATIPCNDSSTPQIVVREDLNNVEKLPSPYQNEITESDNNSNISSVISTNEQSITKEDLSLPIPSPKILIPDKRDAEMDYLSSPHTNTEFSASSPARDRTMVEPIPFPILDTVSAEVSIEEVSESNDIYSTSCIMSQNNISTSIVEDLLKPCSPTDNNNKLVDELARENSNEVEITNHESNQLSESLIISPTEINQPPSSPLTSSNNELYGDHKETEISNDTMNTIGKLSPLRNFTPSYKDRFYFPPKTPPSYLQFSQMNDVLSVARGLGDKISKIDQIDSDNDSVFSLSQISPKPSITIPITCLNLTSPRTNATNLTNSFATISSLANGKIHGNERPTSHEVPAILSDSYFNKLHTGNFSIIDYADMSIEESMDKSLHFSPSIGSPPTLNPIKRRSHNFHYKKLKLSYREFTTDHVQSDSSHTLRVLSPTKSNLNSNSSYGPSKPRSKSRSKRRGFQAN